MKKLGFEDVLNLYEYEKLRNQKIKEYLNVKKNRSVFIGDKFHISFENTMSAWFQIQEMIRAERMVDEKDIMFEIDVYNDLIPEKNQLSATFFIEIPDNDIRKKTLPTLVGIHDAIYISFKDQKIKAKANEQSNMDYKYDIAATIHFLKFDFDNYQKDLFIKNDAFIEIDYKDIKLKTPIPSNVKKELNKDLSED